MFFLIYMNNLQIHCRVTISKEVTFVPEFLSSLWQFVTCSVTWVGKFSRVVRESLLENFCFRTVSENLPVFELQDESRLFSQRDSYTREMAAMRRWRCFTTESVPRFIAEFYHLFVFRFEKRLGVDSWYTARFTALMDHNLGQNQLEGRGRTEGVHTAERI